MIVCHRCEKENQDHYKFCLGCGAELGGASRVQGEVVKKAGTGQPSSPVVPTSSAGEAAKPAKGGLVSPLKVPSSGPLSSPPPAGPPPAGPPPGVPAASSRATTPAPSPGASVASEYRSCPSCNSDVPSAFKFCGVCGSKMPDTVPAAAPSSRALMTLIRPDGSEGGTHELRDGENQIGRNYGALFENDGYLSPLHASMVVDSAHDKAVIRDRNSLNGVFVKMLDEEEIAPGQIIRIGQELLRFDVIEPPTPMEDGTEIMGSPNPGYWGKLTVIIGRGVDGSAFPLLGDSVTLGRERGEINFPDDGYVSGLHARLSNQNGRVVLADLGSSNGTFIKVAGDRELSDHSFVLLGQQLFRITFH